MFYLKSWKSCRISVKYPCYIRDISTKSCWNFSTYPCLLELVWIIFMNRCIIYIWRYFSNFQEKWSYLPISIQYLHLEIYLWYIIDILRFFEQSRGQQLGDYKAMGCLGSVDAGVCEFSNEQLYRFEVPTRPDIYKFEFVFGSMGQRAIEIDFVGNELSFSKFQHQESFLSKAEKGL